VKPAPHLRGADQRVSLWEVPVNAVTQRAKRGQRPKLGKPYYTRKEVREILEQEYGVPVSRSALEKLRIEPDCYYGQAGSVRPADHRQARQATDQRRPGQPAAQ